MIESEYKLVSMGLIVLLTMGTATATTITLTSLPSASNTGLDYKWTSNTWENYCPNCGAHNTLTVNPKGTYEKELTCSACDSDYCGSSGKEKGFRHTYLIKKQYGLNSGAIHTYKKYEFKN